MTLQQDLPSGQRIIPPEECSVLNPLPSDGMVVELGNKKNANGLYRDVYEGAGCRYMCLDWNGQDGAYALDFGLPLPDDIPAADLTTNIGFMEHVYTDPVQAWKNLIDLNPVGCVHAFVMPHPHEWNHHGVLQPSAGFYDHLFIENGFVWEEPPHVVYNGRKKALIAGRARRIEMIDYFYWPDDQLIWVTPRGQRRNADEARVTRFGEGGAMIPASTVRDAQEITE
jgi:hypothetical protein